MKLYLDLLVKKTPNGKDQYSRICIDNIKGLKELHPDDITLEKWREFSTKVWIETGKLELLEIKVEKEKFNKYIKTAYKHFGKNIELIDEKLNIFRIPIKEGAFFDQIKSFKLYSDVYETEIITISIK